MKSLRPLSDEQIKELMTRYYAGEKVFQLIREFGLLTSANMITSVFPRIVLDNLLCPYCSKPMLKDPPTRTSIQYRSSTAIPYCAECGHKQKDSCKCSGCRKLKDLLDLQEQVRLRKNIVAVRHTKRSQPIDLEELSMVQIVNLVSLCRVGRDKLSDQITSIQNFSSDLCCHDKTTISVLCDLYMKQYINLSIHCPPSAVEKKSDDSFHIDFYTAEWQLNLV